LNKISHSVPTDRKDGGTGLQLPVQLNTNVDTK